MTTPNKVAAQHRFQIGDQMVASRVDDFPNGLTMMQTECAQCGAKVWQSTVAREIARSGGLTTRCTQCVWGND